MIQNLLKLLEFNWYTYPAIAVSVVIFCIGLFVFAQNRKSIVNVSFFFICLSLTVWLFSITFVYKAPSPEFALTLYKYFTFLGVSFISTVIYSFSVAWLKLYDQQKYVVWFALLGSALFYLAGLLLPSSFPSATLYFWGYYPVYGLPSRIFLFFFFGLFFAAFFNFVRAYKKEVDSARKTQIKIIAIAFLISFLGSVDYIPKIVNAPIYPIGFVFVFTWIMMVAYSIVKYKVMDIETVIHQTILWLASSSIVVLPIVGVAFISRNWYPDAGPFAMGVTISVLFFLFNYYLKTVQPKIDHVFKRRELDLENTLIQFNESLVHLKGLSELSNFMVQTIREALYTDRVQIYIKHGEKKSFFRIDGQAEENEDIYYDGNLLIQWLERDDQVALLEFVDLDPRFQKIAHEAKIFFHKLDVQVSVPLVLNGELIGFINLGKKASLKPFRAAEVKFLSEFRRAATIALSNSVRLIEMQESLRKWNEELEGKVKKRTEELAQAQKQLVQAEKLATIGTLAGGVAHEINNPLTAVLTNAQLLKVGAKEEDLESIELIEEGAKRCQEIIKKIMKYARKSMGPETVEEVDLNRVVETAMSFLKYQLSQDDIRLTSEKMSGLPAVQGNSNEFEQVITNLMLNAKDALKDQADGGKIEIRTVSDRGTAGFMVTDNGHGISKEDINKIFDPFFTTKAVGKGTGLGLAVTYGIVKKYNGKIEVVSELGKGTCFKVLFPKMAHQTIHTTRA
jgi:signal transduction histidine kinase